MENVLSHILAFGLAVTMPSPGEFTDVELIAFLDEQLGTARSSQIESAIREDDRLRERLVRLRGQNLAGLHTIGAIWRRERLSCPSRETLTRYLQKQLDSSHAAYIEFHLNEIACRVCIANHDDLTQAMAEARDEAETRRQRMFQTSAGHLR